MKKLLALALIGFACSVKAANPAFTDFQSTQFGTTGNKVTIKSGATVTNLALRTQSGGTGIGSVGFAGSWIWANDLGNPLYAFTPINFIVYTNFLLPSIPSAAILTTASDGQVIGLSSVTASIVTAALTNQWKADATNAALGVVATGASNVTINVSTVNTTNLTVHASFTGKSTFVQNVYSLDHTITNGLYFVTNLWSGPTNPVDLRLQDQYYDTATPVSITGFQNRSNTVSQTVVLTLRNISATNVSVFMAANVRCALFTNSFVLLPSSEAVLSMRYSPAGPRTNAINQAFF